MRHLNKHRKLGRTSSHRQALLRNMTIALFRHERIETTAIKAKTLRSFAEKLITLAKRGDLHSRRIAARDVRDHEVLQKLFGDLAERFRTREGGYTRVLKTGFRRGDNSMTALIELVDRKPSVTVEPDSEAPASAAG